MRIGFVGTGIMGRPMARRLQKAGHQLLIVRHRSAPPQELLDAAAVLAESAIALAEASDVVFTMVSDTAAVEDALFREQGMTAGLSPGKVVVDMSSISPSASKVFAERIRRLDCEHLTRRCRGINYDLRSRSGTHALAHTRMATESRSLPTDPPFRHGSRYLPRPQRIPVESGRISRTGRTRQASPPRIPG